MKIPPPNQPSKIDQVEPQQFDAKSLNMSISEKTLEVSHPSIEFQSQALVITVPNDSEESVVPQSSLPHMAQNSNLNKTCKISLHCSYNSRSHEMETQENGPSLDGNHSSQTR